MAEGALPQSLEFQTWRSSLQISHLGELLHHKNMGERNVKCLKNIGTWLVLSWARDMLIHPTERAELRFETEKIVHSVVHLPIFSHWIPSFFNPKPWEPWCLGSLKVSTSSWSTVPFDGIPHPNQVLGSSGLLIPIMGSIWFYGIPIRWVAEGRTTLRNTSKFVQLHP